MAKECHLVSKELPHAVEDAAVALAGLGHEVFVGAELLQHLLLLAGQALGCPNVDVDDEVAHAAPVDFGKAFPLEAQDLTALGAGGNLDLGLARERRNLHRSA